MTQRRALSKTVALYGPLLLALYFVMTTRWGSFLLPGPPYIGDIALGLLIVNRVWTLARWRYPEPLIARVVAIPAVLLLAYATVWLLTNELSTTALRDGAPYFYAVLVLFGQSYREIHRVNVEILVYGALIAHTAWFTVALFNPGVRTGIPTLGDDAVGIFSIRSDFDGAMLGILGAMTLHRILTGKTPELSAAVGVWALVMVFLDSSRASLIACGLCLAFVIVRFALLKRAGAQFEQSSRVPLARGWANGSIALVMLVVAPALVFATSGTPAAIKQSANVVLTNSNPDELEDPTESEGGGGRGADEEEGGGGGVEEDVEEPEVSIEAEGVGTARARGEAWKTLIDWISDGGVERSALGVGFGPHYMEESGADVAFQGPNPDPTVRAVHNYLLNTWARLGIVGMVLIGSLMVLALTAAVRLAQRPGGGSDLDALASLLVVAIPVVAMLGVNLESPFGAIPFFWAIGYLSARMVEEGEWRSLPLPWDRRET